MTSPEFNVLPVGDQFSTLATELLVKIFQLLPVEETISLGSTCRKMETVAQASWNKIWVLDIRWSFTFFYVAFYSKKGEQLGGHEFSLQKLCNAKELFLELSKVPNECRRAMLLLQKISTRMSVGYFRFDKFLVSKWVEIGKKMIASMTSPDSILFKSLENVAFFNCIPDEFPNIFDVIPVDNRVKTLWIELRGGDPNSDSLSNSEINVDWKVLKKLKFLEEVEIYYDYPSSDGAYKLMATLDRLPSCRRWILNGSVQEGDMSFGPDLTNQLTNIFQFAQVPQQMEKICFCRMNTVFLGGRFKVTDHLLKGYRIEGVKELCGLEGGCDINKPVDICNTFPNLEVLKLWWLCPYEMEEPKQLDRLKEQLKQLLHLKATGQQKQQLTFLLAMVNDEPGAEFGVAVNAMLRNFAVENCEILEYHVAKRQHSESVESICANFCCGGTTVIQLDFQFFIYSKLCFSVSDKMNQLICNR